MSLECRMGAEHTRFLRYEPHIAQLVKQGGWVAQFLSVWIPVTVRAAVNQSVTKRRDVHVLGRCLVLENQEKAGIERGVAW